MIKQILKGSFIALILGIILSFNTAAAESGYSIKIDDSGNVTLISENEDKNGVTVLQFSLKVKANSGADISFEFNSENNFKVSEYRYHPESSCLNIYLSDSEILFDGIDSINIGTVSAKDKAGKEVNVDVSAVDNSLKYVYQNALTSSSFDTETTTVVTGPASITTSTTITTAKPSAATSTAKTTAKPTVTTFSTVVTTAKPTVMTASAVVTTTNTVVTTFPVAVTTKTTTETSGRHIASDEEFCNWAIIDYKNKTDVTAAKAEINENSDGQYEIILTDDSGNVLDTYVIDPYTGIGTNSANEEVNLPQTGNNSVTNILTFGGAFLITIIGLFAVRSSGVIRHKKDEE